jgi:hypothetical protein
MKYALEKTTNTHILEAETIKVNMTIGLVTYLYSICKIQS